MGVTFSTMSVLLDRLLAVGFPPVPEWRNPRLLCPLSPRLAVPLLPAPNLRWPALLLPAVPLMSAMQSAAPLGRHSTAISQEHDGHQHTAPVVRSMADAASMTKSRIATFWSTALEKPFNLQEAGWARSQGRNTSDAGHKWSDSLTQQDPPAKGIRGLLPDHVGHAAAEDDRDDKLRVGVLGRDRINRATQIVVAYLAVLTVGRPKRVELQVAYQGQGKERSRKYLGRISANHKLNDTQTDQRA